MDKTALVLGGGGGLGSAIAQALAAEGVAVAVADVDLDAAERCVQALREAGGKAFALRWDLADLAAINGHVADVERELGAVDILVNNTGGPTPTPVHGQDLALWRKHFDAMVQFDYERSADQDAPEGRPARHPMVVVGAGPVGLALAIDLARREVPVVLLDNDNRLSTGSRAICFAKRTLEIFDRLSCGDRIVDKGVSWNVGKVFFKEEQVYQFDLFTGLSELSSLLETNSGGA